MPFFATRNGICRINNISYTPFLLRSRTIAPSFSLVMGDLGGRETTNLETSGWGWMGSRILSRRFGISPLRSQSHTMCFFISYNLQRRCISCMEQQVLLKFKTLEAHDNGSDSAPGNGCGDTCSLLGWAGSQELSQTIGGLLGSSWAVKKETTCAHRKYQGSATTMYFLQRANSRRKENHIHRLKSGIGGSLHMMKRSQSFINIYPNPLLGLIGAMLTLVGQLMTS
jgi:hypothetical protein